MIFAKIDFINLLPFYTYIKKNIRSSRIKAVINYKKSYPADINKKFKKRQIDAAIISSIASKNCKCLDLAIVAKNEVDSVLALKETKYEKDYQSDTSNALAKVLGIEGKIIIGDKALYHFYNSKEQNFVDLAQEWKKRYNLPFVFARLCFNSHEKELKKLSKGFLGTKVKIPSYILEKYAKRSSLSKKEILNYLDKISYEMNYKEKRALKLFLKLSNKIGQ